MPVALSEVLSDCPSVAGAGEGHETSVCASSGGLERNGTNLIRDLVGLSLSRWLYLRALTHTNKNPNQSWHNVPYLPPRVRNKKHHTSPFRI